MLIAISPNTVNMPVILRGNLASYTHAAQETNTVLITSAYVSSYLERREE